LELDQLKNVGNTLTLCALTKNTRVLVGFRNAYVFERLSRDLRSKFYALDTVRVTPQHGSDGSPIIPQFG
jgi:hypothetical protein